MSAAMRAHDWALIAIGHAARMAESATGRGQFGIGVGATHVRVRGAPKEPSFITTPIIPLLGHKHPKALGRHFFSVWQRSHAGSRAL